MLHHIVWWTVKDGVNGKSAKEAAEYLIALGMEKMAGKIEPLLSLEMTANFAETTTQEVGLLLHSTHKDAEALAAYAGHPIHVEFGGTLKQYVSSRQAIDYIV